MTRVTIYNNSKKECVGFQVLGHAGYAPAGEDVVCAAISVFIINTINSIEAFTQDGFTLSSSQAEGLVDYRLKKSPSHDAALLLKAMLFGLEQMACDTEYAEYIQIQFKEVERP